MHLKRPELQDVLNARKRIAPFIIRTPLHRYHSLERLLGAAEVYVKHENYQILGAFKVRGGLNLVAQMTPEERAMGVISASTGNHGQSIAFAARQFGAAATIVVPEDANPGKVQSMQDLGANVIFHGNSFDDAREHVEQLAREEGMRYIHSANEPALIEGVGTYGLEIVEDVPDVDVIFVGIGGGSGACGTCISAKGVNPARTRHRRPGGGGAGRVPFLEVRLHGELPDGHPCRGTGNLPWIRVHCGHNARHVGRLRPRVRS